MTVAHVGAVREKPRGTGFAHLFGHVAFNDSEYAAGSGKPGSECKLEASA